MIELHDAHVTEYGTHLLEHIDDGRWGQRMQNLIDQRRGEVSAESFEATARRDMLLRATYDLLAECYGPPSALDLPAGAKLLDDIAHELDLPDLYEL